MDMGVTAVMLPELDFGEQIAQCQSLGIKYYQYRPRPIRPEQRKEPYSNWGNHKFDLTPERLVKEGAALTRRLRAAGLEPWGTLPVLSVDLPDDQVKRHVEGAAAAEAKCVRCQPFAYPDQPFDYEELLQRSIDRYGEIIEKLAEPASIKLIIETHCGCLAASPALAWNLCRHFPASRLGVIFDLANFAREGEIRPSLAVSVLGPYIDCCHIGGGRRIVRDVDPLGAKVLSHQMCSMQESDLHVPTWLKALKAAGLEPPLIIEDFTPNMAGADRLRQSAEFLHRALRTL